MKVSQDFFEKSKSLILTDKLTKEFFESKKLFNISKIKLSKDVYSTNDKKNNQTISPYHKIIPNMKSVSHVSILNKSSSFSCLPKLQHKLSMETLISKNIIEMNKIINSISRSNIKTKLLSEQKNKSILFNKEIVEKSKKMSDLRSFRNTRYNDLKNVILC